MEQTVKNLIAEMDQANDLDHQILKVKAENLRDKKFNGCAMHRFNMMKQVE